MSTPKYKAPKPSPQELQLQQEQLALMREQREYMARQQLIQEQERQRLALETAETAADAGRLTSETRRYGEIGPSRLVSMPYGGFLVNGQERTQTSGVRRDDPGPSDLVNPPKKKDDPAPDNKRDDQNRYYAKRFGRFSRDPDFWDNLTDGQRRIFETIDKNPNWTNNKFFRYMFKKPRYDKDGNMIGDPVFNQ